MPDRPRVLFITRKWPPATGGMETYCRELTSALQQRLPLEVIALPGTANGMPPGPLALIGFGLKVFFQLLFTRRDYEALHLADMAIWPLGLAARRSARLVISAHGTDVSFPRRGGILGRLYGLYLRTGSRLLGSARIVANSQATAEALAESGWQTDAVIPLATTISAPEKTYGPSRAILFVGRLIPLKGCKWFADTVLPLLDADIRLHVAGTCWDADESAVLDHPRVDFLGRLDQPALAEAYREALCVVVPNIAVAEGTFEGFGLVAPEAAACGGVVLASRSGGLSDAVLDGETGFLLPAGDAAAWAEKIDQIARWNTPERAAFCANASRRAQDHFSWDRVATQMQASYSAA